MAVDYLSALNTKGSGLNIIQAKILNIVLSIRDEIIVETLFRKQRNFLLCIECNCSYNFFY